MSIQPIKIKQEAVGGFIAADLLTRGDRRSWLICLHGLQSNRQMFEALLVDSRFANFNILSLDLVGFGDSSKPEGFDYDLLSQARTVLAAIQVYSVEHAIWIGHSLGGMIATLVAREAPSYVTALVSLEGNLTFADCTKSAEVASVSFEAFQGQYFSMIQEIVQAGVTGERRADWMRSTPDYVFYRSSQSIVKWSRSGELLREFENHTVPKLLMKGAVSQFRSQPKGPFVRIQEIPKSGHFIMLDAPEDALATISSFIEGISTNRCR